jgi:hypothetical protein
MHVGLHVKCLVIMRFLHGENTSWVAYVYPSTCPMFLLENCWMDKNDIWYRWDYLHIVLLNILRLAVTLAGDEFIISVVNSVTVLRIWIFELSKHNF